jgi:hypothetical protein
MKKYLGIAILIIGLFLSNGTAMAVSPCSVAFGCTGASTLTGILQGNGTSAISPITIGSGLSFSGGSLSATLSGALLATGATTGATTQQQTFTNGIISGGVLSPSLLGGTGTTQALTIQTTSGVGATGANINFNVGNNGATKALTILNSGNVGVGITNPIALLNIAAGTTTVAPLQLTSGTLLTTPTGGAIEYNGSHLYVDIGSTRYQLDGQGIAANLSIGTSTITGGSNGNVLYHTAGGVLGEMTTTGSGTVLALQTSPTFLTSAASPIFNATTGIQINGAATSGTLLMGNGTNYVGTSWTHAAPSTAGKIVASDGTNYVQSVPTFPTSSSATSGKIIKSDGTNWIASTETYATPGTSGNVMTSDGTNWTSVATQAAPIVVTYTSNSTWTKPAGLKYAVVETIGGGGGGGGESPVGGGCSGGGWSGGGGGSGAYATRKITASQLGSTETVTVSSSGGAGASGSTTAGSGATNSFGSWVSASGGTGGASQGSGAAGTSSSAYATIVAGSAGSVGNTGGCSGINGANGANSFYGNGGTGGTTNGANGSGYGAGGQGASNAAGISGYTGGNGTLGIVIITEYF